MAPPTSKTRPIAIVGAGVFGLSSALHLADAGYTDITVFEKDSRIPSRFSAAYDVNKIIRAEYDDPFYVDLALEAIEGWRKPLFAPHYHQTGYLNCITSAAPEKARATLQKSVKSLAGKSIFKDAVMPIRSSKDVSSLVWQYQHGALSGWTGYFNRVAGYAHSSNALKAAHEACVARGVKFFLGERDGAVKELVHDSSGRCTGVRTASRVHEAATVIVALGANVSTILPSAGKQVEARSWSVAHVQLTEDEASALRGIPVTYARDLGFFFEPDPATRLLKLCPMGAGFTNTSSSGVSIPPQQIADSAFIPPEDERQLRRLLAETLPELADRPFVDTKLCWYADTKNTDFIVDYVPKTSESLIVLSGDSGHGLKFLPVFGKWVKELLEGKRVERWQWKDQTQQGAEVASWRVGTTRDLKDLVRAKL
ncbi:uncharacterized protein K452DRAFT_322667 [Aplosporella prunicola CBS 121167]|uniref:FAD dependent oxidoreductase domain-containing protein n=1 Tax=Aplosporella prunicola CBS 121167 TaxID=1176127 RepID=A0A6A6AXS3_9PEZI|nr:uncharacterized protein K452DRAFT_322667 [Aplosporella prunicola CBS 121167]KAF2136048.1 hypothetical protein K452DRAFT_322667 [Aplosporella prunicola CBS 121167]